MSDEIKQEPIPLPPEAFLIGVLQGVQTQVVKDVADKIEQALEHWHANYKGQTRSRTVSKETAQGLADSVIAYIYEFGLEHDEEGCPDDDTCKCPHRQAINKALARFEAEQGGGK